MSYAEKHTVNVTTATGGGGVAYTSVVTGRIASIAYVSDGTTPFASTADFTITTEDTAQSIWSESNVTASKTVNPVTAANLESGAASSLTEAPIYAAGERIKIAVAQGGDTKSGAFTVVIA
jgi:hypothetical protein